MSPEIIQIVVTLVLCIVFVVFLWKRVFKVALAVGLICVLFNVGFVMNGTEIREAVHFDRYMSAQKADEVESALNGFDAKRDEYAVIDAAALYNDIVDFSQQGLTVLVDGVGRIDVMSLAANISDRMAQAGVYASASELTYQLKDSLPGISDQDAAYIAQKVTENLESSTD